RQRIISGRLRGMDRSDGNGRRRYVTKPATVASNDLDARVGVPGTELACPIECNVTPVVRPGRMSIVHTRGRKSNRREDELHHYDPRRSGLTLVPSGFMR